jgi:hypothetical protein
LYGYTLMFRTASEYRWWCLVLLLWIYLNLICSDVVRSSTSHFLYGFTCHFHELWLWCFMMLYVVVLLLGT